MVFSEKHQINKNELKKRLIEPIENEIVSFFSGHGAEVRIIYRTCQKDFRKESPHNLIPKHTKINSATIFLSFNNCNISLFNFNKIIAFPDTDADKLPRLEKIHLGNRPKIDLEILPEKYVFKNIDDLKESYFKRFS